MPSIRDDILLLGKKTMSEEKTNEQKMNEVPPMPKGQRVTPRPAVGTFNSYENEMLTVLHGLKYNIFLNAKATVFASIMNRGDVSIQDAIELAHSTMTAFAAQDREEELRAIKEQQEKQQ